MVRPALPTLRHALPWLILVTVVLRLGLLALDFEAHPERLHPGADMAVRNGSRPHVLTFGFEASNIARALVCDDRGFADPFGAPTGPSAWIAPGVVAPYALAFALFGCFTPASVLFVYLLAVALSATLTAVVGITGCRWLRDEEAGVLAAGLFAVSPFDLALFLGEFTFDLNLHALFLVLLLYLLLGVERKASTGRVSATCAVSALATLCNPVFLGVAAVGLVVALWGKPWRRALFGLALLLIFQAVIVGPYLAMQRHTLGAWVPVKSNAPFELHLGSRVDVGGVLDATAVRANHPSQNTRELERYRKLGEIRYVELAGRQFLESVSGRDFATSTLRRLGRYFFAPQPTYPDESTARKALGGAAYALVGLTLVSFLLVRRFRIGRSGLLVYSLVFVYAAPHLVATVTPRYVDPVTPLILLLLIAVGRELWPAHERPGRPNSSRRRNALVVGATPGRRT